jgi:formate dehydrogenase major subunit
VSRGKFEARWGVELNPEPGWHLAQMFDAMERGDLGSLYIIGENPAQSEADGERARRALGSLDTLVVQDITMTATAELADVVFPAAVGWAESEGTVTSSERRVQRVRKAVDPPGEARDDMEILIAMANRLGHGWPQTTAEEAWNELRSLSDWHAGMSYERLEALGGLQWPCPTEDDPGSQFLHARLWEEPRGGPPAPFTPVEWRPPIDELSDEFPIRLTTGRHLDSYNTGVQSGQSRSPRRKGGTIDISPEDGQALGLSEGDLARVSSRRGSVVAPVSIEAALRPGLAFMTLHYPEEVDVNVLTLDEWDPKSGTAEFKATAVRIEPEA